MEKHLAVVGALFILIGCAGDEHVAGIDAVGDRGSGYDFHFWRETSSEEPDDSSDRPAAADAVDAVEAVDTMS